MDTVLACTGYPQRELTQLQQLIPQLAEVYAAVVFSVPPDLTKDEINALEVMPKSAVVVNVEWSQGRHAAIRKALETPAMHIHYADLDRLLHWIETHPEEWRRVVSRISTTDCLIIGRTDAAFQTHPQALQQTERIINAVFSHVLGRTVDLGGGSRGFSRQAVQFLMAHSVCRRSWCTDSEWVMLLYQAGFKVEYVAVDGLASPGYPTTYDTDARRWEFRVNVALDIIQSGLATMQKVCSLTKRKDRIDHANLGDRNVVR